MNANGQKVGGKSPIADPRVFIKIFLVVGCNAKSLIAGEPPTRVGFQRDPDWGNQEYEAVAGACRHFTILSWVTESCLRLARGMEF